jgi:hypothetical protein
MSKESASPPVETSVNKPQTIVRLEKWLQAKDKQLREWIYRILAVSVSIGLVISFGIAIRPDFQSLASLQSISTVLLTVEGILVGLAVLQKSPLARVITVFLSLMALLFSLDTLMLILIVSQVQAATVRTQVDVLPPFTMSPLDLFYWNMVWFFATVISYFGMGTATDLYQISLKKRSEPPRVETDQRDPGSKSP